MKKIIFRKSKTKNNIFLEIYDLCFFKSLEKKINYNNIK